MKIGQKVKLKESGQIGTIDSVFGDMAVVKSPKGELISVEIKKLIILTFFEWLYEKLTSWIK